MPNPDYKPRFSFEVTEEQKIRADSLIGDYGMRKNLFGPILDDLLDLVDEQGGLAIGLIMAKKLKPRELLPIMNKVSKAGENG